MQRLLCAGPQVKPTADLLRRNAAPSYRDSIENITRVLDANERLDAARNFVQVAIAILGKLTTAGAATTSLGRHFVHLTDTEHETIQENYRQIFGVLNIDNFICNTKKIRGDLRASWLPDNLIHVCPAFRGLNRTCQAVVLIFKATHDVGVDAG
jgi:hypothetical protein